MKIIQFLSEKKSRPVTEADIKTVLEVIKPMADLCKEGNGKYLGLALAHCQVEREDRLRFYVMADGTTIINPEIIRHTRHMVTNGEGCMSYAHRTIKEVERWNKCEVRYQEITQKEVNGINYPVLSEPKIKNFSGLEARIVQHEIDHFNGINIYQ